MTMVPPDVHRYSQTIRRLEKRGFLASFEEFELNMARLKLAQWACEVEGIPANVKNLTGVLGEHAPDVLSMLRRKSAAPQLVDHTPTGEPTRQRVEPEEAE